MSKVASTGHRQEDRIWQYTLRSLAARFGVDAPVSTGVVCVDRRMQWRRAGNIRYNAGIHSAIYLVTSPFRRFHRAVRATRNS
jgi:hypothetical protein